MEILNELIAETKEQIDLLEKTIQQAKSDIDGYSQLSKQVEQRYNDVMTWADMYEDCSMEAKKMIVAQLFNEVRIGKEYNLEIDLSISYDLFCDALSDIPLKAEVKANIESVCIRITKKVIICFSILLFSDMIV